MTFRQYLILMIAGTTLATVAWMFVLLLVDPRDTGWFGVIMFMTTLMLMITGLTSIGGLFVRTVVLGRNEMLARTVGNSFRQGLLLAIFIGGILMMKSRGTLTPWTTIFFIVFLTLVEFFLVAFRRR